MEEETITVLAIFAIVISLTALGGGVIMFTSIPEVETNPVTWGAITAIQSRVTQLENNPTYDYDNILDRMRDDIDDLEYDMRRIDDGRDGDDGTDGIDGVNGTDADWSDLKAQMCILHPYYCVV